MDKIQKRETFIKPRNLSSFTMRSLVDDCSMKFKKHLALRIYDDVTSSLTYAKLKQRVDSFSMYLMSKGIEKGDKIAILSENLPNWLVGYLGITAIGSVAVPILPEFSALDVNRILQHSEAKGIIVSSKYVDKCREYIKDGDKLVFRISDLFHIPFDTFNPNTESSFFSEASGIDTLHKFLKDVIPEETDKKRKKKRVFLNKELQERIPSENDIASIIYTSGTTGNPKGVMLSHKNILWNADECSDDYVHLGVTDRVLSILPMSHVYEFTIGQILVLMKGCAIYYLVKPPAVSSLMKAFKMVRPHVILTVPLLIEKIYRSSILPQIKNNKRIQPYLKWSLTRNMIYRAIGRKLKTTMGGKVKFYGIGGAPLDENVEEFLVHSGFPYAKGYGLTETSPMVAGSGPGGTKVGIVGKVVPYESVKLIDVNEDTGIGEIAVKGPNVMKGYYKDSELTAEVFTDDGYFKTGDLGSFDNKNRLSIKGRSKTMILGPGGENIYPEAIEAKFNNQDFVEETLVVPEDGGLVAMIRLNIDSFKENMAMNINDVKTEAQNYIKSLKDKVNKDLMRTSRIDKVELQEEPFIRTPTQKIKRFLYLKTHKKK